jgi:hypothetical protein
LSEYSIAAEAGPNSAAIESNSRQELHDIQQDSWIGRSSKRRLAFGFELKTSPLIN